jgi:hypothetical protein
VIRERKKPNNAMLPSSYHSRHSRPSHSSLIHTHHEMVTAKSVSFASQDTAPSRTKREVKTFLEAFVGIADSSHNSVELAGSTLMSFLSDRKFEFLTRIKPGATSVDITRLRLDCGHFPLHGRTRMPTLSLIGYEGDPLILSFQALSNVASLLSNTGVVCSPMTQQSIAHLESSHSLHETGTETRDVRSPQPQSASQLEPSGGKTGWTRLTAPWRQNIRPIQHDQGSQGSTRSIRKY